MAGLNIEKPTRRSQARHEEATGASAKQQRTEKKIAKRQIVVEPNHTDDFDALENGYDADTSNLDLLEALGRLHVDESDLDSEESDLEEFLEVQEYPLEDPKYDQCDASQAKNSGEKTKSSKYGDRREINTESEAEEVGVLASKGILENLTERITKQNKTIADLCRFIEIQSEKLENQFTIMEQLRQDINSLKIQNASNISQESLRKERFEIPNQEADSTFDSTYESADAEAVSFPASSPSLLPSSSRRENVYTHPPHPSTEKKSRIFWTEAETNSLKELKRANGSQSSEWIMSQHNARFNTGRTIDSLRKKWK